MYYMYVCTCVHSCTCYVYVRTYVHDEPYQDKEDHDDIGPQEDMHGPINRRMCQPRVKLGRIERHEHDDESQARLLHTRHGLELVAEQDGAHARVAHKHHHEEHHEVE